jgi:SAM-dependent methyltransferase
MTILATFTWGRAARAVMAALEAARGGAPVLVLGAPPLGRVLAQRGVNVLVGGGAPRALRRLGVRSLCVRSGYLPFADAVLGAIVVAAAPAEVPAEWQRALRPGGALVLVAAGDAAEHSRRLLCGGLVDLEQRRVGRTVVTSGRRWR